MPIIFGMVSIWQRHVEIPNIAENNTIGGNDNNSMQNIFVAKNPCERCHLSGKSSIPQALTIKPHVGGGAYCLVCHNSKGIHDKHPINKDVTCEKCHGEKNNFTIPSYIDGKIVCQNCHDYPNPLIPSKGNLITVHRERNVSCITCHANTCTKCHKQIGTSEKWNKRLTHFKTILGTLPNENISR